MNLLNSLHPLGVVRWLHEPQSTMVYPELGFPHRVGRYRPVGSPSWFPFCWNCKDMEEFMIRGWDLNLAASGATSILAGGATLATRWLHDPQPIRNQLLWLGFPHRAEQYRPGDPRFRPHVVGVSCRGMERFLIRGEDPILPGCGGISTLATEATLAAHWLHEPQPIIDQPVWLGFPHHVGRHRPGESASSSPGCWRCRDTEGGSIRG